MRLLVGIPCVTGAEHCKKAIDSVIGKPDVDVLIIDNGAEPAVKKLLWEYLEDCSKPYGSVDIMTYAKNIFVNPAWNFLMQHFLKYDKYDYLIIMNSDLIMHREWDNTVTNWWNKFPNDILIPRITDDENYLNSKQWDINALDGIVVGSGTPGVFITLNRKQCEMVYPIPSEILIWFGDQWAYTILRNSGYKTIIPRNLIAYHHHSQTVQKVPGISEMIEEDKRQWELIKHRMEERVLLK